MELELISRGLKKGVKFCKDFEEMLEAVNAAKEMDSVVKELEVKFGQLVAGVKAEESKRKGLVVELATEREAALLRVEKERVSITDDIKGLHVLRDAEKKKVTEQIVFLHKGLEVARTRHNKFMAQLLEDEKVAERSIRETKARLEEAEEAFRKFKAQL